MADPRNQTRRWSGFWVHVRSLLRCLTFEFVLLSVLSFFTDRTSETPGLHQLWTMDIIPENLPPPTSKKDEPGAGRLWRISSNHFGAKNEVGHQWWIEAELWRCRARLWGARNRILAGLVVVIIATVVVVPAWSMTTLERFNTLHRKSLSQTSLPYTLCCSWWRAPVKRTFLHPWHSRMMAKNSSGYEDITEHGYSPSESTTQNCMQLPFILFGMIDKGGRKAVCWSWRRAAQPTCTNH